MPEFSALAVFMVASLVLLVTPGPAVLYIVARSIDQGRLAGIVSTLGIGVGSMLHVVAAALGLSAILVSSALAFSLVKYLGAAYLVFLGLRKLTSQEALAQTDTPRPKRMAQIFYQGVWVNILNPKTALFFFAFLPQFVNTTEGRIAPQVLFLGAVFVSMGIFSDGLWAILAGTVGDWLRGSLRFLQAQRYFTGGVFITLGIATALSGSGKD